MGCVWGVSAPGGPHGPGVRIASTGRLPHNPDGDGRAPRRFRPGGSRIPETGIGMTRRAGPSRPDWGNPFSATSPSSGMTGGWTARGNRPSWPVAVGSPRGCVAPGRRRGGLASVEVEGEPFQVVLRVAWPHRPLMSAKKPHRRSHRPLRRPANGHGRDETWRARVCVAMPTPCACLARTRLPGPALPTPRSRPDTRLNLPPVPLRPSAGKLRRGGARRREYRPRPA